MLEKINTQPDDLTKRDLENFFASDETLTRIVSDLRNNEPEYQELKNKAQLTDSERQRFTSLKTKKITLETLKAERQKELQSDFAHNKKGSEDTTSVWTDQYRGGAQRGAQ